MTIAVPTAHAHAHLTDDVDDLHQGLDVETGRDLSVPRPVDMPVVLSLSAEAAAGLTPVTGLAPASRSGEPSEHDLRFAKIFAAPNDPKDWPTWRAELSRWRESATAPGRPSRLGPQPQTWASHCRSVFMAWLWDERLYDFDRDEFTPDRLLTELTDDFGGLDAIVLWHAYPVIGLDDRNQFDFYDVPGLSELIAWFRERNVRVFLDYNPWDTATRHHSGSHAAELAALLDRLHADGLFLDTLREGAAELVAAVGPDRTLESESRVSLPAMQTHQLSWAQWFQDSPVPGVLRAHWFDRRHMQHHVRRWNHDHSAELQSAWLNGCGVLLWDNVFGSWVGWNERDKSIHRQMRLIQLAYTDLLAAGEWTPLTDVGEAAASAGVFCSCFADERRSLYALVNRTSADVNTTVRLPAHDGEVWNLLTGACLALDATAPTELPIHIPANGIAAILTTTVADEFAASTAAAARSLPYQANTNFPRAEISVFEHPACAPPPVRPAGAVELPAGLHHTEMNFRRRESGMLNGAWWVEAWKPLAPDLHAEMQQEVTIEVTPGTWVRTAPVTNAEYFDFIDRTGYRPRRPYRFLLDWAGGRPRRGTDENPLTHVDLADAQAFAEWAGARLPLQAEWHLAADLRPPGRQQVWQWTADNYLEGPVRFDLLVGGTPVERGGSGWYFESGPQAPHRVAKLLQQGRGLSRSESVGFGLAWGPEAVVHYGDARLIAPGPPV